MRTSPSRSDEIIEHASNWLARRDGGLDERAEAEFMSWRNADVRHEAAVAELEAAWHALDQPRREGREDFVRAEVRSLARRRRNRNAGMFSTAIALAACVAVAFWLRAPAPAASAETMPLVALMKPAGVYVAGPEQKVLSDGSTVELMPGSRIEVDFSAGVRRVRLLNGHAHFAVSKNPARPFIVTAAGVDVRAVGTAFAVKVGSDNVEVIVTEGRVAVDQRPPAPAGPAGTHVTVAYLEAGNSAVVNVNCDPGALLPPAIVTLAPEQIQEQLAFRLPRLEFTDISLRQAIALFNERNAAQIEIADAYVASMRLTGDFRADNIDGFIALLQMNFGVRAERVGDSRILLYRAN